MAWVMKCAGCGLSYATGSLVDGRCADCRAAEAFAPAPAASEAVDLIAALEAARVEIDLLTRERDDLREACAEREADVERLARENDGLSERLRVALAERAEVVERLHALLADRADPAAPEPTAAEPPAPAPMPEVAPMAPEPAKAAPATVRPALPRLQVRKGGAASRIPDATRDRMVEMRLKGESAAEIAAVLGLRPAMVGAALAELMPGDAA